MNRFTYFLFVFVLSFTAVVAQTPKSLEVRWSRGYKDREIQLDFVTSLDSAYFMTYGSFYKLLRKPKNYYARYDRETMTQVWQIEETIDRYRDAPASFHSMVTYGPTTYVFYQAYSKADDLRYVLMRTIDANGDMSDFNELVRISAKRWTMGSFRISWNHQATSFAVVSFPGEDRKDDLRVEVKRFDREGNPIGGASVQIDHEMRRVSLADVDYALNGDVYVLASRSPDREKNEKIKLFAPNLEYFILHADPNDEEFQEVDLGMKDKFVVGGIGVETDQVEGKVAISGMYSDKRYGSTSGMFYMTLDQKTLERTSSDFKNLKEFEYQNNGRRDGTARARRRGLANETYVFRGILPREGGGSLVLMEDYDMVVVTTQTRNGTVTTYYYYYDNIWAMMVDGQGQIERVTVIPKQQYSVNDGGYRSGFLVNREGENFNFLFNDAKGNEKRWMEQQAPRIMNKPTNAMLVQVTLKPDGSMDYVPLIDNRKERAVLIPQRGKSFIGLPGEAVIPGLKRRKWIFMSLRPEPN
ncbi:MAG: hypothetical protein FJX93_00550 [Bacteroidetes bacterium]|nr:hypothetical protein [Bacteroidota bacterium]